MTALYVPGTSETDPSKVIMSVQNIAGITSTNTANIATLTTNAATYVVGPASATANGFAVYSGTTGLLVKDHAATIALSSEVSGTLPVANGGTNYTGGAWTTYTPTISATSGNFTTVSAAGSYLVIGKLVHLSVAINIAAVGTASGAIVVPLPVGASARDSAFNGLEFIVSGKAIVGRLLSGASNITLAYYDNTFPGASGNRVVITGIYEQV